MSARREYIFAALVGIGLAALVVWLAPSGTRPAPAPSDTSKTPGVKRVSGAETGTPNGPAAAVTKPSAAEGSGRERKSARRKPTAPAAEEKWELQEEVDFTPNDLAGAGKVVAHLNLGDYRVAVGEEFEVKIGLETLPLESITLILQYDPAVLEAVQDSARPVGRTFRRGIEFHVGTGKQKGQIALIHEGTPGKKNVNAVTGAAIAAFRMKALAKGETTIKAKDASFTNGLGNDERFDVNAGRVVVY